MKGEERRRREKEEEGGLTRIPNIDGNDLIIA
jgi:hypothetical protein